MTCGLAHASYGLPKWQAVKLTFFAPCQSKSSFNKIITKTTEKWPWARKMWELGIPIFQQWNSGLQEERIDRGNGVMMAQFGSFLVFYTQEHIYQNQQADINVQCSF